jgi:hypothetical protein
MDTVESLYTYKETERGNHLNDKHAVLENKISKTILSSKYLIDTPATVGAYTKDVWPYNFGRTE